MDAPNKDKVPVPAGYREGIVGAITVVLGFSLLFMRYWSLEAPGADSDEAGQAFQ